MDEPTEQITFLPALDEKPLKILVAEKLASIKAGFGEEFEFLNIQETFEAVKKRHSVSVKINYFKLQKKNGPPIKHEKVARYRMQYPATMAGTPKASRYLQKPGSINVLYLPAHFNHEQFWDITCPLIITEGELKAHYANTLGYNCVGVPGVATVRDNYDGVLFEELNLLPQGKQVYIVFDKEAELDQDLDESEGPSRAAENVRAAELRLAALLILRGCKVQIIKLPGELEDKIQLDDYLRNGGRLEDLMTQQWHRWRLKDPVEALCYLQSEYVMRQGKMQRLSTRAILAPASFKEQFGHLKDNDGKSIAAKFSKDKWTTRIEDIRFDPRQNNKIIDREYLNLWEGFGTQPVAGSISIYEEIVGTVFEEEPSLLPEYEKFIAMLLQKPWVKQARYLLARGTMQGTGKSLLIELPACLINGTPRGEPSITRASHALIANAGAILEKNFNSSLIGKIYLVMNETGPRHKELTHKIKALVTDPTIQIEEKFMAEVTMPNHLHLAISSNELKVLDISRTSRRDCVLPLIEAQSDLYYKVRAMFEKFDQDGTFDEYRSPACRSALMAYFLDYDLGDYTGSQPPLVGHSKLYAHNDNMSDVEYYVDNELSDVLVVQVDLEYERFMFFNPQSRLSKVSFRSELAEAGFTYPNIDRTKGQVPIPTDKAYPLKLTGGKTKVVLRTRAEGRMLSSRELVDKAADRYGEKI